MGAKLSAPPRLVISQLSSKATSLKGTIIRLCTRATSLASTGWTLSIRSIRHNQALTIFSRASTRVALDRTQKTSRKLSSKSTHNTISLWSTWSATSRQSCLPNLQGASEILGDIQRHDISLNYYNFDWNKWVLDLFFDKLLIANFEIQLIFPL